MTIDSFNKLSNVIYKPTEKIRGGKLPIDYVKDCRPILILDEVQNYQTDTAKKALRTLHPLFSIGYSATPGNNTNNELYRLSSFEASQRNLVKKIEVLGFQEVQFSVEKPDYFRIVDIKDTHNVEIELAFLRSGKLQLEPVIIGPHTLFAQKTGNKEYGNLAIEKISIKQDDTYVELSNGMRYCTAQTSCASLSKEVVFRQMISETIKTHIERQNQLSHNGYNAKVLSLFFVDKVASYKGDDPLIARLFDEEFEKLKKTVPGWKDLKGADVREGYFAKKVVAKSNELEDIDTTIDGTKSEVEKKAEKIAYELIMKGKEKLLSFDEKVCFIFAHSALREGWDNPNVFQICALREITSESNRRQTIGRGLRLPVSQDGERIHNERVNRLTVIANETYSRFVGKLQEEYIADGIMQAPKITNKVHTEKVKRTSRFNSTEFEDIWRKANRNTEYTIKINTEELIKESIQAINAITFEQPKLVCTKGKVKITVYTLKLLSVSPEEQAQFNVTISDNLQSNLFGEIGSTFILKKGDRIGRIYNELEKCSELGSLKVSDISYNKNNPEHSTITFSKIEDPLKVGDVVTHETTNGGVVSTSEIKEVDYPDIPKCNIIERASKEVKLTRKTVLSIFKGIKKEHQMEFMKNPEGFTSQFIDILKNVVANHIAKNIEYKETTGSISEDKNTLFPEFEVYSQNELVDINNVDRTIYEKVQFDSDVEKNFVNRLDTCDEHSGNVQLYFKFPPKYKIKLPKIIGNYNPDWAIVRRDEQNVQIEIVRETKGTEDLNNLPHSNEKRKIICAQKHFKSVGLEYKVVDDKDDNWWTQNRIDYSKED